MFRFKSCLLPIAIYCFIPVLFIVSILLAVSGFHQSGYKFYSILQLTNKAPNTTRMSSEISAISSISLTKMNKTITVTPLSKILVVPHYNESLDWLDLYIGDQIPHIVYTRSTDPLVVHKIAINKGREAGVYLQYIIEHYSNLPSLVAFIHADRKPWHQINPNDTVVALKALRWNKYPYMPLTGSITETEFRPNTKSAQHKINLQVWRDILQDELGPPPPNGTKLHCCATFVVRRENILTHNKTFYSRILNYILASKYSDQSTGRTLEFTWHMIFGQPAHLTFQKCDLFVCNSKGDVSVELAEQTL